MSQRPLNKRQLEVLRLIRMGLKNTEIATLMNDGEVAIKNVVTRILKKLGAKSRIELLLKDHKEVAARRLTKRVAEKMRGNP